MATIRVTIDSTACEGHGRCYVLSPEVFAADEEGNGEVLVSELNSAPLIVAARLAARNCPEGAITLTEDV
jgi:ferredoxin